MADYGTDININDYLYRRPVYYTNPLNQDREDVIIRMILNGTNFNFSLAKSNLGDLRVAERDNGTHVLRMWIAYLEVTRSFANVYLKLPSILANQTVTLWVFFGNTSATEIKEPDKMGFLFYETFDSSPLSSSKWSGFITSSVTVYGYDLGNSSSSLSTITNPLYGKESWIMEAGTYLNGDSTGYGGWYNITLPSHEFDFIGSDNSFVIAYTGQGMYHTVTTPAIIHVISSIQCPELYSYQDTFVAYDVDYDRVHLHTSDRNTFSDVSNVFYRKVHGDTILSNVVVVGNYWGAAGVTNRPNYISWLVIREFDVSYRALVDCSDLYATSKDRTVNHELLDYQEYGDDITSVLYQHESSFGGNPLLLSDDNTNTTWVSNINATSESEISVTIYFGLIENLTSSDYIHYDSNHVKYFSASKLSDTNEDVWGRNFWDCPTSTNSWAAIQFNSLCVINSCSITAVSEDLDCCPKNYVFFGSNFSPVTAMYKAVELYSGVFSKIATAQQFYFNNKSEYKYYILFILDNYGGSNIRIQEWEMFNLSEKSTKKRVSQLRLLPPTDELLYSFPNEISLQASVDTLIWDTLIPWTQTYSPFIQHYAVYGYWQHYSFVDSIEKGYYAYRLLCRGNWGEAGGRIAIKEWALHELAKEYDTYRILEGTTNIMSQIWASEGCGIDDVTGMIYVTNDKLNYVMNDKVSFTSLPSYYNDINVIQGV